MQEDPVIGVVLGDRCPNVSGGHYQTFSDADL